jgi:CubicO group peptidase (beta-lactamase class C family)
MTVARAARRRLAAAGEYVRALVESDEVVGAVLHVEQDGEVIFSAAYGRSDRERGIPMTADAICSMRSMTKPLVGTAVLMLYEEGRLGLEDPVARYIPAFDNEAKRGITVRHLLTHTSGLTGDIYDTISGTRFSALREAVDWVGRSGPMGFAPGTGFHYSDPGTSTLGALIAEVAGEPSEDFIARRIIRPLGMTDSFLSLVSPDDPRRGRIAATYRGKAGAWEKYWDNAQPQSLPFFRASGGLYSMAADYATFLRAFLRGGALGAVRLLKPATVRMALTDCTAALMTPAQLEERASAYGMHWTLYNELYAPLPAGSFGHGGSDGTVGIVDPTRELVVVFLTQSRGNTVRRRVVAAVMEALGGDGRDSAPDHQEQVPLQGLPAGARAKALVVLDDDLAMTHDVAQRCGLATRCGG